MAEVVKAAVEIEAGRTRMMKLKSEGGEDMQEEGEQECSEGLEDEEGLRVAAELEGYSEVRASSIEAALNQVCGVASAAGMDVGIETGGAASGISRTKEDIAALAQDKHEKALVSQIVSAGEIGVRSPKKASVAATLES